MGNECCNCSIKLDRTFHTLGLRTEAARLICVCSIWRKYRLAQTNVSAAAWWVLDWAEISRYNQDKRDAQASAQRAHYVVCWIPVQLERDLTIITFSCRNLQLVTSRLMCSAETSIHPNKRYQLRSRKTVSWYRLMLSRNRIFYWERKKSEVQNLWTSVTSCAIVAKLAHHLSRGSLSAQRQR